MGLLLDFSQQLGTLDPGQILKTLVDSTRQVIKTAHAGLVLLWEEQQNRLIPRAAAGYTDNDRILQIAYRAGEALPGQIYLKGKLVRVAEVDFAEQYKLTPENLLLYREATGGRVPVSSILVPIQAGEVTLGVLVLDNFNTVGAFTDDDEALITSLTQQTALTLENARLYQASEERTAQLRSLTDVAATITSSLQTDELINTLLDQLGAILPYDTAPINRATVCFSMYSLMSKRINSTPRILATCRVTSVLPTPVGPVNKKHPTGLPKCQTGTGAFYRGNQRLDGIVLAEDDPLETILEIFHLGAIRG